MQEQQRRSRAFVHVVHAVPSMSRKPARTGTIRHRPDAGGLLLPCVPATPARRRQCHAEKQHELIGAIEHGQLRRLQLESVVLQQWEAENVNHAPKPPAEPATTNRSPVAIDATSIPTARAHRRRAVRRRAAALYSFGWPVRSPRGHPVNVDHRVVNTCLPGTATAVPTTVAMTTASQPIEFHRARPPNCRPIRRLC